MFRLSALLIVTCAAPVVAQESNLRDRLLLLSDRYSTPAEDPYAEEKSDDLNRIAAESQRLFGPPDAPADIAIFVSENCNTCASAEQELTELVGRIGVRANIINIDDTPDMAALMARLTLDLTPSYVMEDRLIRGHMPVFVLERYLSQ